MALSPSIEFSAETRSDLLRLARRSIERGDDDSRPVVIANRGSVDAYSRKAAVFVTLTQNRQLRGCIGSLEAVLPLAEAVADAAFKAAYHDRRFAPVTADEIESLKIDIAVLSPMQPIAAGSLEDLLSLIAPGDGILLQDGHHRATFLPKVWEKIESPPQFIAQLMQKAGLGADHWSDSIRFSRYHSFDFGEKETN